MCVRGDVQRDWKTRAAMGRRISRTDDALSAVRFRAGEGYVVALAIEADDEHRASMAVAFGLACGHQGWEVALRGDVADALAETAMAEFFGTAEEVNRAIGTEGSEHRFHRAIVLVAEG